jgi:CRP-like cAMP-binding protein
MPDQNRKKFDVDVFLSRKGPGRSLLNVGKGAAIYEQGAVADSLFYILEGQVKIAVTSHQGKEAIIAVHRTNEFFGEGCLTGHQARLGAARALTDTSLMKIAKGTMLRALHVHRPLSEFFIEHLLVRTNRVEADLVDQLFNSSEKRLARALLILANFGKHGRPEPILAPVNQAMLAEIVGTTRPRISYFMNKFRKLGFISYNGHLRVHSSLLAVLLEE